MSRELTAVYIVGIMILRFYVTTIVRRHCILNMLTLVVINTIISGQVKFVINIEDNIKANYSNLSYRGAR